MLNSKFNHMRKQPFFLIAFMSICLGSIPFSSCSSDDPLETLKGNEKKVSNQLIAVSETDSSGEIIPLDGDRTAIRKQKLQTRALLATTSVSEELNQLDLLPIYLQIKGNTSSKQNLNVVGEKKELTFEYYRSNDVSQEFYLKILPAYMGIPYMIYSKKTNTPISVGSYVNNPSVKVLYARPSNDHSTFGAAWDIYPGEYAKESFVIQNEDYINSDQSGTIYFSVIGANDSKVTLEKYAKQPSQEFSIIPVENFRVESVTFDTSDATFTKVPDVVFSDRFTNNGPIDQNHKFTISESYKETSSFNKKTSFSINLTTTFKVKAPFFSNGITVSQTVGQEFAYGKSEEKTFSISREYPIIVPSYHAAQMTLTLYKYSMDVPYSAVCIGLSSGKRITIKGIWQGVDVHESDAVLNLTPINDSKASTKSIVIKNDMLRNNKGFIKID